MRKFFVIALLAVGACTTNSQGQKVVDPAVLAAVQTGVQVACAVTPTAEAVAAIYTNNPDVTSAEAAVAILCKAAVALPPVTVPAPVATPNPVSPN